MAQGEAAAGEDEAGVAGGDGDGDAGRDERPPAAGGDHGVDLAGVEVEAGVAGVGVGRQRQLGVEADDGHGQAHGRPLWHRRRRRPHLGGVPFWARFVTPLPETIPARMQAGRRGVSACGW